MLTKDKLQRGESLLTFIQMPQLHSEMDRKP